MKTVRTARLLLAAAMLSLGAAPLPGAQVILVNGQEIEGEIVKQDAGSITVTTLTNTITLPRSRVREIRQSLPGEVELLKAKQSIKSGDLAAAKRFLEAARSKKAAAADLGAAAEELLKAETAAEMAKYQTKINDARRAASAGQNTAALQEVKDLLASLPKDSPIRKELVDILAEFHLRRAREHRDKVQTDLAVKELEAVIALDPTRPQPYRDLGELNKVARKTWPQALENYALAVKYGEKTLPPRELSQVYWETGEIHRQLFRFREASTAYLKALEVDPTAKLRVADRAIECIKKYAEEVAATKPDLALAAVRRGLQVRDEVSLRFMEGEYLQGMRRFDEAIVAYQKAVEKNPRLRDAHLRMAECYFSKNEVLQGREMLEKEIAIIPNNYDALCLLGDNALELDDYEKAESYFQRARSVDPVNPRATLGLGKTQRSKGAIEEARVSVQEVLDRLPEDREANLEMGRILRAQDKLEEAKTFFTQVLTLLDKADAAEQDRLKELRADALIARGEINLLTAGPGTASADFLKALEVLPNYPRAFYSIGKAYRTKYVSSKRIEDLKTAEENLIKAQELAPQNPQYAMEIGLLYQKDLAQEDKANEKMYLSKAVANYQRYLDLGGADGAKVQEWIKDIAN